MNRIICWPICIPNARNSEGSIGDIHVFILSCDLKSIQLALLYEPLDGVTFSHIADL